MGRFDQLRRAAELDERGEPYVLATVVAVDRPVSARLGDRAIIRADGRVDGWIGGSCSQPIVVREALAALGDGESRLVRIQPPGARPEPQRAGVVTEVTTCASEGGVDVFVEPRLARPHLVLIGSSPVTRTLVGLSEAVGYRVTAVVDDPSEDVPGVEVLAGMGALKTLEPGSLDAVVVATMNRYDEVAIEAALDTDAGYIGLVASSARAKSVFDILSARGIDAGALERVKSPAGVDLGPSSQEEIALAVMAEVVAERHARQPSSAGGPIHNELRLVAEAIDPVCGMTVAVVASALSAEYNGTTFYFCAPGCRVAFLQHPESFLETG
jgi:xanthine dehydrogenase accessory factor